MNLLFALSLIVLVLVSLLLEEEYAVGRAAS